MAKKGIRKKIQDRERETKDSNYLNNVESSIISAKASIVSNISILNSLKVKYATDTNTMADITSIEASLDFVDQTKLP